DSRQRTMTRYLENRDATMRRLEKDDLPRAAYEVLEDHSEKGLAEAIERLSAEADVIVVDTPGRDDETARAAILMADTLVTPMNDSFVDLDLIGQVHPENYKVTKPSFYDELARRVGFRVIPGLGERVIYRELFPKGLTLLDLQQLGEVGIAHIAARQELREMISGLGIPSTDEEQAKVA